MTNRPPDAGANKRKLTAEQVARARDLTRAGGFDRAEYADLCGVTESTLYKAIQGYTFAWLDEPPPLLPPEKRPMSNPDAVALTPDDMAHIRLTLAAATRIGRTMSVLSDQYHVSAGTIYNAARGYGKAYAAISEPPPLRSQI